jgi:hypothetical protein
MTSIQEILSSYIITNKDITEDIEAAKNNIKTTTELKKKCNDFEYNKDERNILFNKFADESIYYSKLMLQLFIAISKKNVGILKPLIDKLMKSSYQTMETLQSLIDMDLLEENEYMLECNRLRDDKIEFDKLYKATKIIILP